jgi:MerR family copper efflux transcriptional regulator
MKDKLQVRDVVKQTGIDRETLRFYEQRGLLPTPQRTEAGYRKFDQSILLRLKFIKLAQDVGFSLKEISNLLNIGKNKSISKSDLKRIADAKISDIDDRIKSLKSMRKLLVDFSQTATRLSKNSDCPILSQFKNLEF